MRSYEGDNFGGFGAHCSSPLRQKPLQMGEAAGVAEEFDLLEQLSSAYAAFRPAAR
jgi:hypothetical protein